MNSTTRISKAERFGHWFGRRWRGYACCEQRVAGWLVSQGVSKPAAKALLWVAKLAVLAMLLYIAFWFAMLAIFVVGAAWMASQGRSEGAFELQYPTTIEELRDSPGYDPNLYEDTSHEMYRDN